MAEKEDPDAILPAPESPGPSSSNTVSTSSWWSPWIDAAKTKSSEVFQFVKKDFNELTTVVTQEATAVVNSTAAALKDTLKFDDTESTSGTLKRSVSKFLDSVGTVLSPPVDDVGVEALLIQNDKPVPLSRFQTKLYTLITSAETFTLPIETELKPQFESWLTIGDEQLTMDKLTKLLVASPDLHKQYESMVPDKVSHLEFWQRYLFRKALLEDEESLLEAKEKKEVALANQVKWEQEDFSQGVDLTEEEQMKILEDYEKEKKTNPKTKSTSSPEKQATNASVDEPALAEKDDLVVVEENTSNCSNETLDKDSDDWEKDFDLDDSEISSTTNK